MDFLPQQNQRVAGDRIDPFEEILATGKRVVIIGGGDTGADCLGTCTVKGAQNRSPVRDHAAATRRNALRRLRGRCGRCSCERSSHEEGGVREWAVATTKFKGDEAGNVNKLHAIRVGYGRRSSSRSRHRIHGRCGPGAARHGLHGTGQKRHAREASVLPTMRAATSTVEQLHDINSPASSPPATLRRGQSLVVWAIAEGRKARKLVDQYLAKLGAAIRICVHSRSFAARQGKDHIGSRTIPRSHAQPECKPRPPISYTAGLLPPTPGDPSPRSLCPCPHRRSGTSCRWSRQRSAPTLSPPVPRAAAGRRPYPRGPEPRVTGRSRRNLPPDGSRIQIVRRELEPRRRKAKAVSTAIQTACTEPCSA